ncbi:hypothetical protein B0H19DRAFT_1067880 [Mycena capillaripes]|nr:hypothetical protein B0H19DRAFT_1067880 [Mycena capillaripes]
MTRLGASARKREKAGLPPTKPGRISWVHSSKLVFMCVFKEDFIKAAELGKVQAGKFYDDVADQYLAKYGYKTPYDSDLDEGQDVASDVDEDEDVDELQPEEAEERSNKNKKPTTFRELFGKPELAPPAPMRPRVLHFYSERFYKDHIKWRFNTKWVVAKMKTVPPAAITLQSEAIREVWKAETEPFKAELIAELDKEHKAAQEANESTVSGEAPQTPEEFQTVIDNTAFYLQPFVNAAAEHFGMNMSLLMCGPVLNRGGAIEMHGVHARISKGMVGRIWPDFDRTGFEATRCSLREFTDECFSTEECRARSLNGMTETPSMGESPQVPEGNSSIPEGGGGEGQGDNEPDDEQGDGESDKETEKDNENDEEENNETPLRNVGDALGPDLAAEVALMGEVKRSCFVVRVRWLMSDEELERENNMARNRRLMRKLVGGGFFAAVQSDRSRTTTAGNKRRAEEGDGGDEGAKRARQSKKTTVATSPRRTRGRARREEEEEGAAGQEDEGSVSREGSPTPGDDPLVRPEDGNGGEGPLLPANPPDVPRVRPKDSNGAEGPLPPTTTKRKETPAAWMGADSEKWQEELRNAVAGFARLQDWGGPAWIECVKRLIAFECAWGFPAKGLLVAPAGEGWPGEGWWQAFQPEARGNDLAWADELDAETWEDAAKTHSCNGLLLFVGCLLWWGDAATSTEIRRCGKIGPRPWTTVKHLGSEEKATNGKTKERKKEAQGKENRGVKRKDAPSEKENTGPKDLQGNTNTVGGRSGW